MPNLLANRHNYLVIVLNIISISYFARPVHKGDLNNSLHKKCLVKREEFLFLKVAGQALPSKHPYLEVHSKIRICL